MLNQIPGADVDIYAQLRVVNVIATGTSTAILGLVCWILHRRHREPFLGYWGLGWSCIVFAQGIALLQLHHPLGHEFSTAGRAIASTLVQGSHFAQVYLLLAGISMLVRGERVPRHIALAAWPAIVVVPVAAALLTIDASLAQQLFWRVGARTLIVAVAFATASALLLRHARSSPRLGIRIVAVGFLGATALAACNFTVFGGWRLLSIQDLLPWTTPIEVLVLMLIGLGLVIWMLEIQHSRAESANQIVTERTQALLQAQRMESVGQIASGVAHDFNNVLTVVIGNAENLLRSPGLPAGATESLEDIRSASLHAAKMTTHLLAMARNKAGSLRVADLCAEIDGLRGLLARIAGPHVQLQFELPAQPCRVRLMRGHLEQVLLNFVQNARDAIAESGTISIRLHGDATANSGGEVVLSVSDDGAGMTDEVKSRIGEAFFTTKGERGTGIGIASVRAILEQTGGALQIDSVKGAGTTMTVRWPQVRVSSANDHEPIVILSPPRAATILLVDDDAMVRSVTSATLVAAGYRVLTAEDAERALQCAATHHLQIDAVLTDLAMPGMSGAELAKALRQRLGHKPILFFSGYVDMRASMHLPSDAPLLGKPFTREELISFVAGAVPPFRAETTAPASEATPIGSP